MEKSMFTKNFLSGIFFLGGIALIFVIIFMIGKERGFTQPKFQVEVLLRDVGGLIEVVAVSIIERLSARRSSRPSRDCTPLVRLGAPGDGCL